MMLPLLSIAQIRKKKTIGFMKLNDEFSKAELQSARWKYIGTWFFSCITTGK